MSVSTDRPLHAGVRARALRHGRLVLSLENSRRALDGARLEIADHLAPLALAPRVINRIEVILEELVSNVLNYGCDDNGEHAILVAVAAGPEAIELVIEDDGRPFDPVSAPEPPPFESLETARIGGLGIRAVRRLSTDMRYDAAPRSALWDDLALPGSGPVNRLTVQIASQT
jgi:serine/threonine-protein kinase RsbW